MANRFPLIANASANQVQELPAGDNLNLMTNDIVNVGNVYANSNVVAVANITASYYFGNGYYLTGLPAGYSNSDVANYLPTYTGNINANNINSNSIVVTNNITANYFVGNAFYLTGLPYSNANVANYLPVYSGNLGNGAGYVFGNGAFLTGLAATYSNSNVANYLPTYTGNLASLAGNVVTTANISAGNVILSSAGNIVSGTGNLTLISTGNINLLPTSGATVVGNLSANYYFGNGAFLTGIAAGNYSNSNVANYLPVFNGNILANYLTVTGNVVAPLNIVNNTAGDSYALTVSGNAGGGVYGIGVSTNPAFGVNNDALNAALSDYVNYGITAKNFRVTTVSGGISPGSLTFDIAGNLTVPGNVLAAANVSASYYLGNGAFLTGLYSNANVANYLPTYTGNLVSLTDDVITTANVQANNLIGNIVVPGSNTDILFNNNSVIGAAAGLTFDSATNTLLNTGNISSKANVNLTTGSINLGISSLLQLSRGVIALTANTENYGLVGLGLTDMGSAVVYGATETQIVANTNGTNETWNFLANSALQAPGDIITPGNVKANYLIGNVANVTGNVYASGINVTVGSLPQVGALINTDGIFVGAGTPLTEVSSSANITNSGNISAQNYFGNSTTLTGVPQAITTSAATISVGDILLGHLTSGAEIAFGATITVTSGQLLVYSTTQATAQSAPAGTYKVLGGLGTINSINDFAMWQRVS